jgi:hypothetical protein
MIMIVMVVVIVTHCSFCLSFYFKLQPDAAIFQKQIPVYFRDAAGIHQPDGSGGVIADRSGLNPMGFTVPNQVNCRFATASRLPYATGIYNISGRFIKKNP